MNNVNWVSDQVDAIVTSVTACICHLFVQIALEWP